MRTATAPSQAHDPSRRARTVTREDARRGDAPRPGAGLAGAALSLLLGACAGDVTTDANGDACRVGTRVGQCAPGFSLPDADGATVSLSDFAGQRVLLVAASMWCTRCQTLAGDLAAWHEAGRADDQVLLNVLLQNRDSELPSVEDAATWRDTLALPFPVLADDGTWRDTWDNGGGRHTYAVVGADGVVAWRANGYDEGTADELIQALDDAP